MKFLRVGFLLAPLAIGACDSQGNTPQGPGVALKVAPLNLPTIGGACFDLRATNAANGGGQTVWSKGTPGHQPGLDSADGTNDDKLLVADPDAICSTIYGNARGGDITYIGTCDAGSTGSQMNSVTVWFDGLYDVNGMFMPNGGPDGWQDPCGTNGCTLNVLCKENADAEVLFNFTVLRDAQQGFFDIAVNFRDIFCSAKYDTCYDGDGNSDSSDDKWIELLFSDDGDGHGNTDESGTWPKDGAGRDHTGVLAVACTGGVDGTANADGSPAAAGQPNTILSYSAVTLVCGNETFDLDLSPSGDPQGNQTAVGSAGTVLQYALYFGKELLTCDNPSTQVIESCNKEYLNVAIDLEDLPAGGCSLRAQATAEPSNGVTLVNGQIAGTGVTQPYIDVNVTDAKLCQKNPLNASTGVSTFYGSTFVGGTRPLTMCYKYVGEKQVEDYGFANPYGSATTPIADYQGVISVPLWGTSAAGAVGQLQSYPREIAFKRFGEVLGKGCNKNRVVKDFAVAWVKLDAALRSEAKLWIDRGDSFDLPENVAGKVAAAVYGVKDASGALTGGNVTLVGSFETLANFKLASYNFYGFQAFAVVLKTIPGTDYSTWSADGYVADLKVRLSYPNAAN